MPVVGYFRIPKREIKPTAMVLPAPSGAAAIADFARSFLTRTRLAVLALWLALLVLIGSRVPEPAAVQLYLALSVAVAVCCGFAERGRAAGELSAYSVFNPGGARLLGEITAAQFDNEVRRRPVEYGLDDDGGAGSGGDGGWGSDGGPPARGWGSGRRVGEGGAPSATEENPELESVRREIFQEARRSRMAAAAASRLKRAEAARL